MLTLYEELLLLSIHEAKGTLIGSSTERLKPGLGGAVLAELAMLGKIQFSDNHRLQLVDGSPTQVSVLDEALDELKGSEKDRKAGYWINTLSQKTDKLRKQTIKSLVQKAVVSQDEDRLGWIVPSPLQPEIKASAKYVVIQRLRGIVLAQEDFQPRDIVLLSLVRACGLLELFFLSDERKLASKWINELFFSQAVMDPSIQPIQEIEAAIASVVEED